ncbi:MAG TPA: tetratricopeptide repeat protein [Chitinophagales bacterium]|nr:tetratricopeptide repeat protein [Chitinophagales bacterium]
MTLTELNEITLDLVLKGEYQKVIELLNNDALLQYPEAPFFLRRGVAYKNLEQYDKAIADYNRALELKPGYADAYHNRARVWERKGEFDKAIEDYSRAIELNPGDAEYYNGRGVTSDSKGKFQDAIADYLKAIELDPTYLDAYNNLGVAYHNLKQYDKALDCYNIVINLDATYPLPYLNRGATYEDLGRFDIANADYNKALQLRPGYPEAYAHIGKSYTRRGNYVGALHYFEEAYKYAPYSKYFKKLRDEAKARAGEAVSTNTEDIRFSANYVEKAIAELPEEEKRPLRQACALINERVEHIRSLIVYKGTAPVVHYTQLRTADIMVMNSEARLRYSNVVFMNDPEEGKVLLDFMLDTPMRTAFERGTRQEDNNIYLGSFLPEEKDDYLVMWRTYGKNELKEEAAGCSLTFRRTFFDKQDAGLYTDMQFGEIDPTDRQALYHVLYYDKEKRMIVSEGNKEMVDQVNTEMTNLKFELAALLSLKDPADTNDESKKNAAINKFMYRYVSELRYFFKSADYQFEKELRVIKFYMPHDPAVKTDQRGNELPRRLYIESTNLARPNISKIVLGPKVPHPERWMYLDVVMKQNSHETKMEFSKCKFQ